MTTASFLRALAAMPAFALVAGAQTTFTAPQADSAFQRADWATAARAYDEITRREPNNPQAWFRLGIAQHALANYDAALAAYTKTRAMSFQIPATLLRLARVHALRGDTVRAFEFLAEAVKAGVNQPAQIESVKDFASLRETGGYKAIVAEIERKRYPCRAGAEHQHFNFWIGKWDVTPFSPAAANAGAPPGFNEVQSILDNCVLLENWKGPGGDQGKSFNYYDRNLKKWRQVWVADGGGVLDYTGEFRDGAMRFEGWTLNPQGRKTLQRLTFFPISADTVRQLFETSGDEGKTWQPGFDGRYVRRKP